MPKLIIELIPQPLWYKNVRSEVSKTEWMRIRMRCFHEAKYTCGICGVIEELNPHLFHCHEVFSYDDVHHIQTLTGFQCLCEDCHTCKHLGKAELDGKLSQAVEHLRKINKWLPDEANLYANECFLEWGRRNKYHWTQNLNYYKTYLN